MKLKDELAALLNKHSMENGSDTPDFILAEYLLQCLAALDVATLRRSEWYEPPAAEEPTKCSSE